MLVEAACPWAMCDAKMVEGAVTELARGMP
jgi:hypothetical protein